jgi:hypothetical protein
VDKARILSLGNHELVEYAKTFGCLERKTWKLLDAHAGGQSVESTTYLSESLWPSQKQADAFTHAERPEDVRAWWDEMMDGIELAKTVRYIDEGG